MIRSMRITTRFDDILGVVATCPTCREGWPFDGEFWKMRDGMLSSSWPARCIACCLEYYAARRRETMHHERHVREVFAPPEPAPDGRCGSEMRGGAACARRQGHRYGHRSVEAMRSDAARAASGRAA